MAASISASFSARKGFAISAVPVDTSASNKGNRLHNCEAFEELLENRIAHESFISRIKLSALGHDNPESTLRNT
jgi:hypothetical protein